jgi:hypothetical protein
VAIKVIVELQAKPGRRDDLKRAPPSSASSHDGRGVAKT